MGEGPCLSVHGTGQAVLATDEVMAWRWPTFHSELIGRTPFRSILSVPLDQPGLGGDVAMDLYYDEPRQALDVGQLEDVQDAADVTAVLLGTDADNSAAAGAPMWLDSAPALSRQRVWTALGMMNVGLHLNTVDALATLRGYAYSHGSTVDEVARHLTAREVPVEALAD
jgi:hypothetical protein